MFGKNAVTKPMPADAKLNVHSIFYTLQGEGPWAGMPTIFVRFAGCNLRCFWCDTDFEKGEELLAVDLIGRLEALAQAHNCTRFVLTGGEPLLQPLTLFLRACPETWQFQVETAGTVWPVGLEEMAEDERLVFVCSPKTGKVHAMLRRYCSFWKYIVGMDELTSPDGLPMLSTQEQGKVLRLFRPEEGQVDEPPVIYVQARDDQDLGRNEANLEAAAAIALRHGYRLSVQIHKLVGLP